MALRRGGVTECQGSRTPGGGIFTWIIIIPHQNEGSGRRLEAISYEQSRSKAELVSRSKREENGGRSSSTQGRNMQRRARRQKKTKTISSSLAPQPKREQSDQFSKTLKASTDHRKVSGTSAEAHDPERIVDWPCHSLRE